MEKRDYVYQCLLANPKQNWTVRSLSKHFGTTESYMQLMLDCLVEENKVVQEGEEVVAV